jgi:hypothetical protein
MAKRVEDTIAATSGFPGVGGLGAPDQDTDKDTDQEPEAKPQEEEENAIDFPVPEGFEVPTGVKQGDEFTVLASLKMDEDGDLQLTKIDGIPVKGESEEDEEKEGEEPEGEQNPPGATGAEGTGPTSGGSAIASARGVMGEWGMPG